MPHLLVHSPATEQGAGNSVQVPYVGNRNPITASHNLHYQEAGIKSWSLELGGGHFNLCLNSRLKACPNHKNLCLVHYDFPLYTNEKDRISLLFSGKTNN